ncbi:MAG: hypothetical protein M3Q07_22210 [Pseudobdellovibrionaceae bacterium]|nr:hypothetical protein [Pseudobdellovibrionaceae bacterium]
MTSPDDVICKACSYITRLVKFYDIETHDWPLMQRESPELWKRIDELEQLGPLPLEETHKKYRTLILNYERMFMRRASRRERKHAA